jgi:hypothetical protein
MSIGSPFGDVVGEFHFGVVVRPPDATTMRGLVGADGMPIVAGPSLLTILERFPAGALPNETTAALNFAITNAQSIASLRYDVQRRELRVGLPLYPRMRSEVAAHRLLARGPDGIVAPTFEKLFAPAVGRVHIQPGADLVAGFAHFAGIVDACCADVIEKTNAWLEECWMADPQRPVRRAIDAGPRDEMARNAEQLFAQALDCALEGRLGEARMNMKLASIYVPDCARYYRATSALSYEVRDEPGDELP